MAYRGFLDQGGRVGGRVSKGSRTLRVPVCEHVSEEMGCGLDKMLKGVSDQRLRTRPNAISLSPIHCNSNTVLSAFTLLSNPNVLPFEKY